MDPCRPCFLRQTCDQLFDLFADGHHHVGKFIDDDNDKGQRLQFGRRIFLEQLVWLPEWIENRFTLGLRLADLLVEAAQIPHAQFRHQLVAAFHFGNAPAQRVGGVLHVGNDGCQQMRDAFVNLEFQHFRIDQDQPHFVWPGLVENTEQHGVDRNRFTRTGGARHQQVRHAGDIRNHGRTTDVLAQRQRQRRMAFVEGLRGDDLAQCHQLAVLVWNLQADRRLARNHLDDPHADHRQRARQILRQAGDLADLGARFQHQFKAGNNRPRMHLDDFRLDVEVTQFQLHLTRQRLQRSLGIAFRMFRRFIQQGNRRQIRFSFGRLEQLDLTLANGALAFFRLAEFRLDAGFFAFGDFRLLLLHDGFALLARHPALAAVTPVVKRLFATFDQAEDEGTHRIHQLEPGQAAEQGDARKKCRQQQQGRTHRAETLDKNLTDRLPQQATGIQRQVTTNKMHRRQSTTRNQRDHKPQPAQANRAQVHFAGFLFPAVDQPAAVADDHRRQIGKVAKQVKKNIRKKGADDPAKIFDILSTHAGMRPAGIAAAVTQQCNQQEQCQRHQHKQDCFTHPLGDVQTHRFCCTFLLFPDCLRQNIYYLNLFTQLHDYTTYQIWITSAVTRAIRNGRMVTCRR